MVPVYQYNVSLAFSNGLGYGDDSKPTFDEQSNKVGTDFVAAIRNLLATGHILAPVDHMKNGELVNDDGCGDGRAAVTVFEGEIRHRFSLCRPKVFGGGVMMSAAMLIGLGYADESDLLAVFRDAMKSLDEHDVNYGAHIDNHSQGGNSGCGAIDNAPLVLSNIVKYRDQILETLQGLQLGIANEVFAEVIDNFTHFAATVKTDGYQGKAVLDEVIAKGKVVKELDGGHKELFILLNMVDGTTADQSLIRDVTDGKAQLFDVDVWRLQELSQKLYGATAEAEEALVSELVYTLGVAATLTHGDLPVYVAQPQAIAAPVA